MTEAKLIEQAKDFVKNSLQGAEGGHDWFHTLRVYNNALHIGRKEQVNTLVVGLAALLHDIADSKFHDGNEELGPAIARKFLLSVNAPISVIDQVIDIIRKVSFKNSLDAEANKEASLELQVVQDADRLDALGAIGIARAFNYGGYKNRPIHNPEVKPNMGMTKEEYKKSAGPTINHFYEKLLKLKAMLNTQTGKELAGERHEFMIMFLEQFYKEWDGKS